MKSNEKYFGFGMIGQTRSHIQLVKTIAAIIAFESVKINRMNMNSCLDDYRVPLDIDKLYNEFVSHSYGARKAMKNLKEYFSTRK